MSQIICQNLAIGYEGKAILENINFSVNKGDYLCIVGENGAGKSTLMRTLLHLQQPIRGKILLGDETVAGEIGYLPQQTQVSVIVSCSNGIQRLVTASFSLMASSHS